MVFRYQTEKYAVSQLLRVSTVASLVMRMRSKHHTMLVEAVSLEHVANTWR